MDKARFVMQGKPLLAYVMASLALAHTRFIVSNRDYPEFGVPVYPDVFGVSPLAGVLTALEVATSPWVAVAACDMPGLTSAYWQLLAARRKPGTQVVFALNKQAQPEPLAAFYHASAASQVRKALEQKQYALRALLTELECCVVPWGDVVGVGEDVFLNVNYVQDIG